MKENTFSHTDTILSTCAPLVDGKRITFQAGIKKKTTWSDQLSTGIMWHQCEMNDFCVISIQKCPLHLESLCIIRVLKH
jgi:hypothetical protein